MDLQILLLLICSLKVYVWLKQKSFYCNHRSRSWLEYLPRLHQNLDIPSEIVLCCTSYWNKQFLWFWWTLSLLPPYFNQFYHPAVSENWANNNSSWKLLCIVRLVCVPYSQLINYSFLTLVSHWNWKNYAQRFNYSRRCYQDSV